MDLVITGARAVGHVGLVDVFINAGLIEAVRPTTPDVTAIRRIDAKGGILSRSFAEPHCHPDKALTYDRAMSLGMDNPYERQVALKRAFTVEDVEARAARVFEGALQSGVGLLRGQVDIDSITRLISFEGVLRARERFRGLIDIQVTAFPQEGVFRDPEARDLLIQALEMGADCIGGWPNYEENDEDRVRQIDTILDLAERYDVPVDINVDYFPKPEDRMLEQLAKKTLARGLVGRVQANHCGALEAYPDAYAGEVAEKVAEAGISIVVVPNNLFGHSQGLKPPFFRGLSRAKELLAAGINVAAGTGNLNDNWCPFGRLDPVQVGFNLCLGVPFDNDDEIATAYEMITTRPAQMLGGSGTRVQAGEVADLVLLDAVSLGDVFRDYPGNRTVIKNGRIVGRLVTERWTEDARTPAAIL
jgi:cytosine/creatinine deaminase